MAAAVAILIGFSAYLRPRELTSLTVQQLIAPVDACRGIFQGWALNLFPTEGDQMSKAGYFDETVLLDSKNLQWLAPLYKMLTTGRKGSAPLWPFGHRDLAQIFKETAHSCNLTAWSPCLYSLRHGGASYDCLAKLRTELCIMERGRWASTASLKRYKRAARAQLEAQRMPERAKMIASAAAAAGLETLFHNPSQAKAIIDAL